jgi:hypothetical protein
MLWKDGFYCLKGDGIMLLKTPRNGGKSSLQEVANTWKTEDHDFGWSKSESDAWAVEFAKKAKEALLREGPAKPDPRNVH